MRHLLHPILALTCGLCLSLNKNADACTSFGFQSGASYFLAKNLDWEASHGALFLNTRGLHKKAIVIAPGLNPLEWTSKYASATLNQVGRDLPFGGINEEGLAIEILWDFQPFTQNLSPSIPATNESQWVQFLLDRAATVDEAVQLTANTQVAKVVANVHYIACDAKGDCAVFEMATGNWVIKRGSSLVTPTLANESYSTSVKALRNYQGFGGTRALPSPSNTSSEARFVRAASAVRTWAGNPVQNDPKNFAFETLKAVKGAYTVWSFVYDLSSKTVTFRTTAKPEIKEIKLAPLFSNADCTSPVRVWNLESKTQADFDASAANYSAKLNASLAARSAFLTPQMRSVIETYALTVSCTL